MYRAILTVVIFCRGEKNSHLADVEKKTSMWVKKMKKKNRPGGGDNSRRPRAGGKKQ